MSEFSESFHLRTTDRAEAVALLERSGLAGWVLEPTSTGWTGVVLDRDFTGGAEAALIAANEGVLALWVLAEDHGYLIELWDGNARVGAQQVEWTFDLEVEDQLDVTAARDALGDRLPIDWDALRTLLATDLDAVDDPADIASAVADVLGLVDVEWLSGPYLRDGADGREVRYVEGGSAAGSEAAEPAVGAQRGARGRDGLANLLSTTIDALGLSADDLDMAQLLELAVFDEVPTSLDAAMPDLDLPPGCTWSMVVPSMDVPPVLSGRAMLVDVTPAEAADRLAAGLDAAGYAVVRSEGVIDGGAEQYPFVDVSFDRTDAVGFARIVSWPHGHEVQAQRQEKR